MPTTFGCPILATSLFLWLGWGSTKTVFICQIYKTDPLPSCPLRNRMLPVSNYCPDQNKFMSCQTNLPRPALLYSSEESYISPVNTAPPAPRFLLSGASGMLGTALKEALAAHNSLVLQLIRREPSLPNQLPWNPAATPSISHTEALEDLTAAIHLSGANLADHRWTPEFKRQIAESRIHSTLSLATTLAGPQSRLYL